MLINSDTRSIRLRSLRCRSDRMRNLVEFYIRFDGQTSGLSDHRLSLAAFQNALGKLLAAVRRMADSEMHRGRETRSRFGKIAQRLDLQLSKVEDGCVQLAFQCVLEGEND